MVCSSRQAIIQTPQWVNEERKRSATPAERRHGSTNHRNFCLRHLINLTSNKNQTHQLASKLKTPPMSSPPPLNPSDLLFSTAHTTLNQTLTSLKRKDLSISNRLHSIVADATFVQEVASAYQLPLITNERCGSWYAPPSLRPSLELGSGSAYFKSTDGHHGQWSFSLRRLNLQILQVIGANGG